MSGKKNMNYCHICGSEYSSTSTNPLVCTNCGNENYINPSPTVSLILFNDNKEVLISERVKEPYKGKYNVPSGFVELNESLEEAVEREIQEETGLSKDDYSTPEYLTSKSATYRYSKDENVLVASTFFAKKLNDKPVNANDDVASLKFVSINDLDKVDFSREWFPDLIKMAHKKLFNIFS